MEIETSLEMYLLPLVSYTEIATADNLFLLEAVRFQSSSSFTVSI